MHAPTVQFLNPQPLTISTVKENEEKTTPDNHFNAKTTH